MNYEFYADVFFLTNFYLDFLAVYLVSEILQQKKRLLRYLFCCAAGSLTGILLFLKIDNYDFYLLCAHFIVNPAMTLACFIPTERKRYIKAFCLMYFVILLLGGSVEWIYVTLFDRQYYELSLALSGIPAVVFLYMLRRKRKNVQCFCQAVILHKGKTITLPALYDTGNRLLDPYVKEPAHIVSKKIYEKLHEDMEIPIRLIPFSSVGCADGMIMAFTIERLIVEWEERKVEFAPAVLAAADDSIFWNRAYQMILHNSVSEKIEMKKGNEEKICT